MIEVGGPSPLQVGLHLWAGGPGCYKNAGRASYEEQASKLHPSMVPPSTTASRLLPCLPSVVSSAMELYAEMNPFLFKSLLVTVFHHIAVIET